MPPPPPPQLVDQNTALKKEAGIAERKLLARNERIMNLEQLLQDADRRLVQQNVKFEQQLIAMKDRIEAAQGSSRCLTPLQCWPAADPPLFPLAASKAAAPAFNTGRIAKPIRGGGGNAPPAPAGIQLPPTTTLSAAGAVPGSPLSRVRDDDGSMRGGNASQKRQSWFFSKN